MFDLENNLPDELFSTSGGPWGASTGAVSQPTAPQPQQQQQQQQIVQRPPQNMGPANSGMGMQMGLGQGAQQNGTLDAGHHHQQQQQMSHMMQNKSSLNNMSGGAISGSAMGPNNMNMTKGPPNSKLNSPPGQGAPMMMNSMGNGPQMMGMQQQQQQGMNNMLNPGVGMGVNMGGLNSGNVPMKTPASMMNAVQIGQAMHNGPQSMMGNANRPVGGMPNNMMQQQAPLRGQLHQGMNPQGSRLQVGSHLVTLLCAAPFTALCVLSERCLSSFGHWVLVLNHLGRMNSKTANPSGSRSFHLIHSCALVDVA